MTDTQAGLLPCPETVERIARALCKQDECDPDAVDYKNMPQWMERRYFEDAKKLATCGLDETNLTICELGGTFALHFHNSDKAPLWHARDYQGAYDIRESVLAALYRQSQRPSPPASAERMIPLAIRAYNEAITNFTENEQVTRMRAALQASGAAVQVPEGWRDIESAPKYEGPHDVPPAFILIVYDGAQEETYRVQTAFWNHILHEWQPCDETSDNISPSHWMPLPAAPQKQGA